MENIEYNFFTKPPADIGIQEGDLFSREFSGDEQPQEIRDAHQDKEYSEKDQIGHHIAIQGGKLIGVVLALKRNITYHGKDVLLGGIGGVAMLEEFRRQGIASKLIASAMKQLKEEGCDIAYLCTDTNHLAPLYTPHGFVKMEKQYTLLGKSGKRYYEWDGMIAPVNSQELFEEILHSPEPLDIGVGNW